MNWALQNVKHSLLLNAVSTFYNHASESGLGLSLEPKHLPRDQNQQTHWHSVLETRPTPGHSKLNNRHFALRAMLPVKKVHEITQRSDILALARKGDHNQLLGLILRHLQLWVDRYRPI